MKKILIMLLMTQITGQLSHAATIFTDDFSTDNLLENESRYNLAEYGQWASRNNNWSVTGGVLSNDLSNAAKETPVVQLSQVTSTDTSLTEVTISFDYTVDATSTLYFYGVGYSGTASDPAGRLTQTNGAYHQDYTAAFTGGGIDLDGTTVGAGTANALGSFTNASGTFSQTYDISSYAGINNITDFSYIGLIFTVDTTSTTGNITIDNMLVTAQAVPEPSTFALLGLGLGALVLLRRR